MRTSPNIIESFIIAIKKYKLQLFTKLILIKMIITRKIRKLTFSLVNMSISTQVIKQHHKEITKKDPSLLQQYPKTFQDKVQLLNNPTMIQAIQIMQYGAKYKPGKRWLVIFLLAAGFFGYLHQKILPTRIIDRYFTISGQSFKHYSGFIGAALMYPQNKPFFLYIPLLAVVYQITRFVSLPHLSILIVSNWIINSILGKYIVDQRLKKYQVWDQQRIVYGQGTLLSIAFAFWSILGFKDGFQGLKAKVFMKSVPGLGIIRQGIPTAVFCLFYSVLQAFYYYKGSRNSQLVGSSILNGLIFGLIFKRFKPLLK